MKKISLYLTLSLLVVVAIAGIGVGYYFVPLYSQAEENTKATSVPVEATSTEANATKILDSGHLDALIAHHEDMLAHAEEIRAQAGSAAAVESANQLRVTLMRELDMFKSWKQQLDKTQ